ncbi:MAG: hypothetical protein H7282_14555 [Cytophagaceae bacterium]|nr:hypothetical protein [Cytophagaceae bacterium]
MNKSLLLLLLFSFVIFSCKKSASDDPLPGGRYRLAYITTDQNSFHYIYNAEGNCVSITLQSEALTRELKTFEYNVKNQLTFYTNKEHSEIFSYEYAYTTDSLLAICKQYYDYPSNFLYATYRYHYDTQRNLNYVVRDLHYGQTDSVVYSKYVNGRPLQSVGYHTENNTTSYTKIMYTYDSRMNRTKVDASLVNDSTSFYTESEITYFQIDHPKVWQSIAWFQHIQPGVIADDMNLNSKNQNTDYIIGFDRYESCGISYIGSSQILSQNEMGLPVHITENNTGYDCNHNINGKNDNDYKMVYETY